VIQRRRQIIEAAVPLFVANGYHKTTTRQIARAAGFSIGSMYEYVNSKEDILYLVCLSIHDAVEKGVEKALSHRSTGRAALVELIGEFFRVCHRMADQIQLMYQVTKSLPTGWKRRVLENEIRITQLVVDALKKITTAEGDRVLPEPSCHLIANNITILGHMWTFRRWHLAHHYTIDTYIELQTQCILGMFGGRSL
jgi:TetR/AcrR family transcriptional regulator, cholesterol catabolism regulator